MSSVAEERIKILLERALEEKEEDVSTALKIAESHNIRLPEGFGIRICNGCGSFLHPGRNSKVRVSSGTIRYKCDNCGEVNRHGYR